MEHFEETGISSIGDMVIYSTSFICDPCFQVYIMGCMLAAGVVMYSVVEIQLNKQRRLASDVAVL